MYIYMLNIYIRNSSHRDYQSRRDGTMSEQEERKKKERRKQVTMERIWRERKRKELYHRHG